MATKVQEKTPVSCDTQIVAALARLRLPPAVAATVIEQLRAVDDQFDAEELPEQEAQELIADVQGILANCLAGV